MSMYKEYICMPMYTSVAVRGYLVHNRQSLCIHCSRGEFFVEILNSTHKHNMYMFYNILVL